MPEPRRILLLMDNRRDANWGSRATTTELVRLLMERFPQAEIRGLNRQACNRPSWARSLGRRWAPRGPVSDWRDPLGELGCRLLTRTWRDLTDWPELIVVNGEGTLHPQQQTEIWLPVMAWLARRTGAPLWVVNCSIQVSDRRAEPLFRSALTAAQRIVVREPLSLAECERLGLKAKQGADCAFLAEPASIEVAGEILVRLGVRTPYAILTGGASAGSWSPESISEWVSILRERGLDVLFTASTPTDRELQASAAPETPVLKAEDADYRELLALIGGASLHVGGRYHPAIFAAMSGTPTVTLRSNTHKMEGLAQLLDTAAQIYDPAEAEQLLGILRTLDFTARDDRARARSIELREFARRNVFERSGA